MSEIKTMGVTVQSLEKGTSKSGQYAGSEFTIMHTDELDGGVFVGPKQLQEHVNNKRKGDTVELVYRENSKKNGWVAVNVDGVFQKKQGGYSGGYRGKPSGGYRSDEPKAFGIPKSMVVAWVKDLVVAQYTVDEAINTIKEITEKLDS